MKTTLIPFLLFLITSPLLNAQDLTEVDFELKEEPWHIEVNNNAQFLKYYYHTTSEKEDIETDIYTIGFDGKTIAF